MNIAVLRIPCEPPCTEPYARWCGSRGRATAPSYPMMSTASPLGGRMNDFLSDPRGRGSETTRFFDANRLVKLKSATSGRGTR